MGNKKLSDFETKLDCIIEYYNTFRSYAEQRRNLLRMMKERIIKEPRFSPSDKVELEHLEKLVDQSNELFPYVTPLQDFKKEILKNHG